MGTDESHSARDPSVSFEEYLYWANLTRSKEALANAARIKDHNDGEIREKSKSQPSEHKNISVSAQNIETEEQTVPSPIDGSGDGMMRRATQQECARAERALRTTSWGAVFFLITTDIIGPMTTPWAFAQTGYGPGVALYTVFGALAA